MQQKTEECEQLHEKVANLELIINSSSEEKGQYEVMNVLNIFIENCVTKNIPGQIGQIEADSEQNRK